jgi:hypothetical protein
MIFTGGGGVETMQKVNSLMVKDLRHPPLFARERDELRKEKELAAWVDFKWIMDWVLKKDLPLLVIN